MAQRVARRVINFANLPIKLLMPTSFTNISEIALKTIPSATKIEIKRVLESLYGFEVEKVHTLNMEGKKKKRGGILLAKPDYKKAYVTLKSPLSISPEVFPIKMIEDEKKERNKQKMASFVEEDDEAKRRKSHWLEGNGVGAGVGRGKSGYRNQRKDVPRRSGGGGRGGGEETAKFPWNGMRHGKGGNSR